MSPKSNGIVILLAVTAGFLGGIMSNQLFDYGPAYAEKKQKLVIAEEF